MLAQPRARNSMHPYQHDKRPALPDLYAPPRWDQNHPTQRPYAKSVGSYTGGLTYAQHELLRQRKTPSGRQVERLDLANIDAQLQLPAPKHVLLSLSPPADDARGLDTSYSARHGYPHHTSSPYNHPSPRRHPNQRPNDSQFDPAWCFPGAYDSSTFHSNPPAMQRMSHNSWSQVPTVMPANLQTTFGPTASAGQQYYGPYWPDGTFSPYRPAPVRDDRFFHWRHSRDLSRDLPLSPMVDQTRSRPSYEIATDSAVPQFNSLEAARDLQYLPPRDVQGPYSSFQERISTALDIGSGGLPFRTAHPVHGPTRPIEYADDYVLRPTAASEKLAHRDRTFTWAYRVYIELLAQIQHDSKISKQQAGGFHTRQISKPSIYPRPPQRSRSHFSGDRLSGTKHGSQYAHNQDKYPAAAETYESRPATAIRMPRHNTDPTSTYTQREFGGFSVDSDSRLSNMKTFAAAPIDTAMTQPAYQNAHQCSANAASALDMVEMLCQDAEAPWLDGMLLAGCLAYGVGKYNKALSWYQRVIRHDAKHVEAMSNMAATLLALGKCEEAASYWSTAIKLRPGYFEAVEHLVGLYVSTHRTGQAVDIIEYIESCLKLPTARPGSDSNLEDDSDDQSRTSSATMSSTEGPYYDFEVDRRYSKSSTTSESMQGFGAFGYAIPAADNGRLLALIHAKGNMLYSLGKNREAALAFEDAIMIATGDRHFGIRGLIERILRACVSTVDPFTAADLAQSKEPILLSPERAQQIAQRLFPPNGHLPGLELVPSSIAQRAAVSTASNSLLSLAKIYQDGLGSHSTGGTTGSPGTREILALYYLSLSLQPSPSTANNVGILLAGVQTTTVIQVLPQQMHNRVFNYTGVIPGSGVALALSYYNYGLNLDGKHAHLYTNLGSLLKDLGELQAAIKMYETAVSCDGNFDIALANLANAVKDQGRIADAIKYYRRAVKANPDFAEAVCGLATALNSVCDWYGRGGVYADGGTRDRVHVDEKGMMQEVRKGSGWMHKVVEIVEKQLRDGESWGVGVLTPKVIDSLCHQLTMIKSDVSRERQLQSYQRIQQTLQSWSGRNWEGSRVVRLLERATRQISWQWYQDRYKHKREYPSRRYARPMLPANISVPSAPTVLPFHTFTTPLSAKQVRQISQRNALRISVSTMRSSWLPRTVYPPPPPPNPYLKVGYVSSDFNNHPLAHLMQSIFGLHNPKRVRAHCYATSASDGSIHRQQIENEAPVFHDASAWSVERLVKQIVEDGIHVLVNLNGYTRGAKNELFAARPAPIHMSFMGFAGTLGAEWCDYVYADELSIPQTTLAPFRYNVDIDDKLNPQSQAEDQEDWIYAENVIFSRSTFFCVDHKQSAPDVKDGFLPLHDQSLADRVWQKEQDRRWQLRKELFPSLPDTAVILGNFNQLYKIDPSTFRMYLRILSEVPNAVLWLLRFPDVGEQNLLQFARAWAGPETASRIVFTDVAPKGAHITRASVVDLFLDTPECNAHTTAADVIWSGTPIVTWARWDYKMCSRMASSIVASALPETAAGDKARNELLVGSELEYEERAIQLARDLSYRVQEQNNRITGHGTGRLMELRRMLWEGRWTSRLFDTKRWVRDVELAYWKAWEHWENGEGGDIWL